MMEFGARMMEFGARMMEIKARRMEFGARTMEIKARTMEIKARTVGTVGDIRVCCAGRNAPQELTQKNSQRCARTKAIKLSQMTV
jgi:hypothetical protein